MSTVKIRESVALKSTWIFSLIDDDGKVVERKEYKNIIVTVGKQSIANRLGNVGAVANEGAITYIAIGTDATAPLVGDVALGTELARKVVGAKSLAGTQISIRAFFTKAQGNGALKEAGAFGDDAGAGADSGTMYNHVNIDVAKDNTKGLQVEVLITVN